jgi:hypothetical protein
METQIVWRGGVRRGHVVWIRTIAETPVYSAPDDAIDWELAITQGGKQICRVSTDENSRRSFVAAGSLDRTNAKRFCVFMFC